MRNEQLLVGGAELQPLNTLPPLADGAGWSAAEGTVRDWGGVVVDA